MLSQETAQTPQIQIWPIDRLVFYARNPRKNDAAVDRMCSSIREFGFKIQCSLAATARSSMATSASRPRESCGSPRSR